MIRLFRACSGCILELTVNLALGEIYTAGQTQWLDWPSVERHAENCDHTVVDRRAAKEFQAVDQEWFVVKDDFLEGSVMVWAYIVFASTVTIRELSGQV